MSWVKRGAFGLIRSTTRLMRRLRFLLSFSTSLSDEAPSRSRCNCFRRRILSRSSPAKILKIEIYIYSNMAVSTHICCLTNWNASKFHIFPSFLLQLNIFWIILGNWTNSSKLQLSTPAIFSASRLYSSSSSDSQLSILAMNSPSKNATQFFRFGNNTSNLDLDNFAL